MLTVEGIERALPEKPNERLLICWPGAALDGITSPEGGAPLVVWLLGYQEVLPAVLKDAEQIYALDADIAHSMTRQLGRLVKHLPPMIQSRLTNPVGSANPVYLCVMSTSCLHIYRIWPRLPEARCFRLNNYVLPRSVSNCPFANP